MAATKAKLGVGVELMRGDGGSPETFTKIPEVRTIPPVGGKNDLVEVTNLDSRAKEYIYGLSDGKELTFDINYDRTNAQHLGLISDQVARTTRNFELFFPDVPDASPRAGQVMSFAALVIDTSVGGGPNEARTMSATLKISGAVTITVE